jgi:hypothetical protein
MIAQQPVGGGTQLDSPVFIESCAAQEPIPLFSGSNHFVSSTMQESMARMQRLGFINILNGPSTLEEKRIAKRAYLATTTFTDHKGITRPFCTSPTLITTGQGFFSNIYETLSLLGFKFSDFNNTSNTVILRTAIISEAGKLLKEAIGCRDFMLNWGSCNLQIMPLGNPGKKLDLQTVVDLLQYVPMMVSSDRPLEQKDCLHMHSCYHQDGHLEIQAGTGFENSRAMAEQGYVAGRDQSLGLDLRICTPSTEHIPPSGPFVIRGREFMYAQDIINVQLGRSVDLDVRFYPPVSNAGNGLQVFDFNNTFIR